MDSAAAPSRAETVADESLGTPGAQIEPSPVKLAHKRACVVPPLAHAVEREPEVTGRWHKLRRVMGEIDAMVGAEPQPGTPELGPPGTVAFHFALAAFCFRHLRYQPAIDACRAGVAVDPYDMGLRRLWLEILIATRRVEDAAPILEMPSDVAGGPAAAGALALLQWAGRVLRHMGMGALALDALEQALALRPSDSALLRELVVRAEECGDEQRASVYRARLRAMWGKSLPDRLADGLASLKANSPPMQAPDAALAWAWALADKTAWSRDEWRHAVNWGARSTKLLVRWWLARPERADEIAELTDAPDLEPVRAGQAAGRAQIMAGSHAGPLPAGIHHLETSGLPFRILGGNGLDLPSGERNTLISLVSHSAASRGLIAEIRRAGVLAMAADAPAANDSIELEFLGRRVAVKTLPARLAQRYGCDTWWYQPLWRGDRIVIELERLPDPEPDEPPEAWAERWARAYLKRLKRVMRGDPRNLNPGGGIWRFADNLAP